MQRVALTSGRTPGPPCSLGGPRGVQGEGPQAARQASWAGWRGGPRGVQGEGPQAARQASWAGWRGSHRPRDLHVVLPGPLSLHIRGVGLGGWNPNGDKVQTQGTHHRAQ